MQSTKNMGIEITYDEGERKITHEQIDTLEALRTKQRQLDECGFSGDADVVVLGLEDMESELTMEQAEQEHRRYPYMTRDRRKLHGIAATPDDARYAREHDVDGMLHPAWDDES